METSLSINRRVFLAGTSAFALAPHLAAKKHADKPNVIILWTDEQRADTMAVYGNQSIHAPNLNRLASESVMFQNAYVSQPVCTPSRSTVMTGLWPHASGCTANNIPLPLDIPCYPQLVNDPDYRTGYFGKWHLGDEIFPQHGFEEWESMEDGYRSYYRDFRDKDAKSGYWHYLQDLGYKPDSGGYYSRGFAARLRLEHCKPKFLERKACDFIRRHRDEPFILSVNFLEPHMPFYGPLNEEHSPEQIDLPLNHNDPLEENEPLRYRLLREHYRQNGFEGHDLMSQKGWRRLICNYWGLVTQVDVSVGAILKLVEDLDLTDNTIVVYTSDHGDMMGSHQLLAKTVMYQESVQVPLLMRAPGVKPHVVRRPVSHIDLVPTLLSLVNYSIPSTLPGCSLAPLIRGENPDADPVFIEWNPAQRKSSASIPGVSDEEVERVNQAYTRTVVSPDGWKLCLSDNDKCQLFNLHDDPGETTNLFDDRRHRDVISRLTSKIHAWQESVDDVVDIG
ncbi:MAG: sulfatase-like hydrolase/transferase [Pirellulales bacterium]|nr:sulfatase-like hydrolase/transferase [Pirellulales bacterium]